MYNIESVESLMRLMVGDHYIIGGQGHELTKQYLDIRRKAKPDYFSNGRYEWLTEEIKRAEKLKRKLYCEDCSGLVMHCNDVLKFWKDNDLTANGIYKRCKIVKPEEVIPGGMLFKLDSKGTATHMAWVGTSGTYEAVGTVYGVVLHKDRLDRVVLDRMDGKYYTKSPWTCAGIPKV